MVIRTYAAIKSAKPLKVDLLLPLRALDLVDLRLAEPPAFFAPAFFLAPPFLAAGRLAALRLAAGRLAAGRLAAGRLAVDFFALADLLERFLDLDPAALAAPFFTALFALAIL